jgi:hypothetical protein
MAEIGTASDFAISGFDGKSAVARENNPARRMNPRDGGGVTHPAIVGGQQGRTRQTNDRQQDNN